MGKSSLSVESLGGSSESHGSPKAYLRLNRKMHKYQRPTPRITLGDKQIKANEVTIEDSLLLIVLVDYLANTLGHQCVVALVVDVLLVRPAKVKRFPFWQFFTRVRLLPLLCHETPDLRAGPSRIDAEFLANESYTDLSASRILRILDGGIPAVTTFLEEILEVQTVSIVELAAHFLDELEALHLEIEIALLEVQEHVALAASLFHVGRFNHGLGDGLGDALHDGVPNFLGNGLCRGHDLRNQTLIAGQQPTQIVGALETKCSRCFARQNLDQLQQVAEYTYRGFSAL